MSKMFTFVTRRRVQKIPLRAIIYMENDRRKVIIHTKSRDFTYYGKLTDAMEQLDENFVHCHRSYVINLEYVIALRGNEIVFMNAQRLLLGRHSFNRLKKMVKNQIIT